MIAATNFAERFSHIRRFVAAHEERVKIQSQLCDTGGE